MRKLIALFALVALPVLAEGTYQITQESSLSTSTEVITVRLGSTATVTAVFDWISIDCSADVDFSIESGGTFSSGTAMAENKTESGWDTAIAVATRSTSISGGTTMTQHRCREDVTYILTTGALPAVLLSGSLTIRTESSTAEVIINAQWRER